MSWSTKRILTIFTLLAAAAWFFGFRTQAVHLVSGVSQVDQLEYQGMVDTLELVERQAQGRVYDPLELRAQFGLLEPVMTETALLPDQLDLHVGDETGFWVFDEAQDEAKWVTATLRYAGELTLMYVDNTIEIDQQALEQAALDFEKTVYPLSRQLFGVEDSPGVDGDPRLTILHTPLDSAGGYYSSSDTEPQAVNRFSNQREMFVIGSNSYTPGEQGYMMILAHEFQHMIHDNQQPNSSAWFNEGMSMLAQDLNGHPDEELALIYLANPDQSLTDWAYNASETGEHYGAAQLFLRYFYQQYGGVKVLQHLLQHNAGNHPKVFADLAAYTHQDISNFYDLFANWAVANLMNDPDIDDGRYAYDGLPAYASTIEIPGSHLNSSVNQLGVDFLGVLEGPHVLKFDGEDVVTLTGTVPNQGNWMWWSGRGDARVATLTRPFDLREIDQATLQFSTWYEIERHYDYAYVTVSDDEGKTWKALPGKATNQEDPQGNNLGNGFTGVSGHPVATPEQGPRGCWMQEQIDLSPFAGQQVLVRFWMVNDPAYHAQGLLLDEIRIPEIDYYDGAELGDGGWQSDGFIRTTGGVPQEWELRWVVETDSGIVVRPVKLDEHNQARMALSEGEFAVLVVIGASPITDEPAHYTIESYSISQLSDH